MPANSEGADVKAFAEPAARPPLTVGSTVSNAEDTAEPAQPVQPVQLESAIVPPDFQRQKVPLEKGFSQMDWMRLQSKGKDLQGNPMNGMPVPLCLLVSQPCVAVLPYSRERSVSLPC